MSLRVPLRRLSAVLALSLGFVAVQVARADASPSRSTAPVLEVLPELSLQSGAAEIKRFEALRDGLAGFRDAGLQELADLGTRMLQAVRDADAESFVTARALFELRAERLSAQHAEILASLQSHAARAVKAGPTPDISVTSGCASELSCYYGSPINCSCTGSSTCTASPNTTTGGSISCNCPGTVNDRNRSCPAPPPVCVPDCNTQCGETGGFCTSNGTCACY